MLKLSVVTLLGCWLYQFLSYTDVYILVKGKTSFNASIVKLLYHTDVVYKIMSNAYEPATSISYPEMPLANNFDSSRWNYAIIARKFVDDRALDEYLSIVRHLDFIEETHLVTTLVSNYEFIVTMYNYAQHAWAGAGTALGFLPPRPLRETTLPSIEKNKCRNSTNLEMDEIHTVSLFDVVNHKEMSVYQNFFLWKVFPTLSLQLGYNGKPQSSAWSNFVVFKYNRYADFCELVSSDLFGRYAKHREKAMNGSLSLVVSPL